MLKFIYLTSFSKGETVLETLAKAGHDRKIPIKIAQNEPNGVNANTDYLAKYGKKKISYLNFPVARVHVL